MSESQHNMEEAVRRVGDVLNDPKRPLKERFRALFTLRNLGGATAIDCIATCFRDSSVLLKHELAYCLGQMQDLRALPVLSGVLADITQDPMVRHEAAEALGAIGDAQVCKELERHTADPAREVAETCSLALARLAWLAAGNAAGPGRVYSSVDPAPPAAPTDVATLGRVLLDEDAPLFERYRAMFALRDLKTPESIDALGAGLKRGTGSALFRHEVAFVFGQVQSERSVPFLCASLEDQSEHEMVRHEAAEALGAIATKECTLVLQRFLSDASRVVRESCEVALDMSEYENSPELQYADTLLKVSA